MEKHDVCSDCERIGHHGIDCPHHERNKTRIYAEEDPRNEGTPGSDDPVNHPNHYTFGKYEVVDVLHDWQLPYPLDNVVKYSARAGKKGGPDKEIQDLKKAQFYLNYRIARLEEGE
jgi:hypothetical protein